jgi:hypothetical protein
MGTGDGGSAGWSDRLVVCTALQSYMLNLMRQLGLDLLCDTGELQRLLLALCGSMCLAAGSKSLRPGALQ